MCIHPMLFVMLDIVYLTIVYVSFSDLIASIKQVTLSLIPINDCKKKKKNNNKNSSLYSWPEESPVAIRLFLPAPILFFLLVQRHLRLSRGI